MLSSKITPATFGWAASPCAAEQDSAFPAPPAFGGAWRDGPIRASGLSDGCRLRNFNNPASGVNRLGNFDVKSNR